MSSERLDILLGFRSDTSQVNSAQRAVANLGASLRTVASTFGVAFGAAGVGMAIRSAVRLGSEIRNLSDQATVSTDSWQALTFVLRRHGIEQTTLANSLNQQRAAIAQARDGLATYTRAFDQLGIDVEEFAALPVDRQFERIAQAVMSAEDRTTAYGAASQILGRRNAPRLQRALEDLAREGLDGVTDAARRAGQVIGEETVDRMEVFGTRIEMLKRQAQSASAVLVGEFLGIGEKIGIGLGSMVYGVDAAADAIERMREESRRSGGTQNDLADDLARTTAEMERQERAAQALARSISSWQDTARQFEVRGESDGQRADRLRREAQQFLVQSRDAGGIATPEGAEADRQYMMRLMEAEAIEDRLIERQAQALDRRERADRSRLTLTERAEELEEEIAALQAQRAVFGGAGSMAEFETGVEITEQLLDKEAELETLRAQIEGIDSGIQGMTRSAVDFAQVWDTAVTTAIISFSSHVARNILQARSMGEAWQSIGMAVAQTVLQMIIQESLLSAYRKVFAAQDVATNAAKNSALVAQETAAATATAAAWTPAALLKSIVTWGAAALVGAALLVAVMGGISGRRHGGPVSAGTPYLVGEEGPELVVPDQSATVISNRALVSAGPSGDGGAVMSGGGEGGSVGYYAPRHRNDVLDLTEMGVRLHKIERALRVS